MTKTTTHNLEEFKAAAERFIDGLKPGNTATLVGLSGDLGAGKTTFVQCVAARLRITDVVNSPTFVIMKSYSVEDPRYRELVHIDAYRLESGEDLQKLGWDTLLADPKKLIMLEWPERVTELLPKDAKSISFENVEGETREIVFDK